MSEKIKKLGGASYPAMIAAVVAIISLIVYIVNATTGYMSGREMNFLIVIATLVSIVLLAAVVLCADRLDNKVVDLMLVLAGVLLIVGLSLFILDRVSIIADIYFLPVNYPDSEAATMNSALAGFVLYLLGIVMTAASAFITRPGEVS